MMKAALQLTAIMLAAFLAGCVTKVDQLHNITGEFYPDEVKSQMEKGNATIAGTAFFKQRGGGVVTCAGNDVTILPASEYATDRMRALYGAAPANGQTVARPVQHIVSTNITFAPDIPLYKEYSKTTKCDSQGNFEFQHMKNGNYFVTTGVFWQVGSQYQGGSLVARITVQNGQAEKIIMSY